MLRYGLTRLMLVAALVAMSQSAQAGLLTIDQFIYQTGTGVDTTKISGTLDVQVTGANQLTFTMTNTSADAAFTDSGTPAIMLLTGFGVQVGANIVGTTSTVSVGGTSTALNFDSGQSTTDITNQYNYGNSAFDGYNMTGVLAVSNIVSSVNNGGATRFGTGPSFTPGNIDGPGYGALSSSETQFGSSTPGVQSSIVFVLNFNNTVAFSASTLTAIDTGNVVLAFGSPDTVPDGTVVIKEIPEPASLVLAAIGGLGAVVVGRRRRQQAA